MRNAVITTHRLPPQLSLPIFYQRSIALSALRWQDVIHAILKVGHNAMATDMVVLNSRNEVARFEEYFDKYLTMRTQSPLD
jgi:hypothetical protein